MCKVDIQIFCTLKQWHRHEIAAILQMTLSSTFSCMKIQISLKYDTAGRIDNEAALFKVQARDRTGNTPSGLLAHEYVTRKQCINSIFQWLEMYWVPSVVDGKKSTNKLVSRSNKNRRRKSMISESPVCVCVGGGGGGGCKTVMIYKQF